MNTQETVDNVIKLCDGMLEDVISLTNVKEYNAVVYKLIQLNMTTLARLSSLYIVGDEKMKLGMICAVETVMTELLNSHVKEVLKGIQNEDAGS